MWIIRLWVKETGREAEDKLNEPSGYVYFWTRRRGGKYRTKREWPEGQIWRWAGGRETAAVFTMSEKMYPRNAREYYMNMCIQGFGREEGGLDDLCQKSTKMWQYVFLFGIKRGAHKSKGAGKGQWRSRHQETPGHGKILVMPMWTVWVKGFCVSIERNVS